MPPFEEIEQHLGSLGVYARSEEEGWYIAGIAGLREEALLNGQRESITTAEVDDEDAAAQK